MDMKIFTIGLIIISALAVVSMILTPSTALQASNKGLKLYLTIDTNLNDDVIINTYQYGDGVYTHDGFVNKEKMKLHYSILVV